MTIYSILAWLWGLVSFATYVFFALKPSLALLVVASLQFALCIMNIQCHSLWLRTRGSK